MTQGKIMLPAKVNLKAIEGLDTLANECREIVLGAGQSQFGRALSIAEGIQRLRGALTPEIMQSVMALQGSRLGFRTDLDAKGGYPVDVVRDALIEAVMSGAYPVNNEFNIIASQSYLTLNYYKRRMREYPGLTDVHLRPGVPQTAPSVSGSRYRHQAGRWCPTPSRPGSMGMSAPGSASSASSPMARWWTTGSG